VIEIITLKLTKAQVDTLIRIIEFGQIEIMRQMKRLNSYDNDLKEYYFGHRLRSNHIKRELESLRGF